MKSPLLHSARTGLVFAIVHIFLVLIGFNTLVGTLLARVSGAQLVGSLPPARFMVIYTLLLALWAGLSATRRARAKTFTGALGMGAAAGFAAGMIAFLFSLGIAWFLVNKVDFRQYLAVLSFDFIRVTLFNLSPLAGALATAGLFTAGGALGGAGQRCSRARLDKEALEKHRWFL